MTCTLNPSSGEITFLSDALPATTPKITFTAYDGAKLFPTVVVMPTTESVIDLDFTPYENTRPLSSCFIAPVPTGRGNRTSSVPLCPPRLKLMIYSNSLWVRQSTKPPSYHTENSGALKVFGKEEEEHEIYITLPQEDAAMTILELSEDLELMDFHVQTLEAFCAVCSHSNLELAKCIDQYISSELLMKCLQVNGGGSKGRWVWLSGHGWVPTSSGCGQAGVVSMNNYVRISPSIPLV